MFVQIVRALRDLVVLAAFLAALAIGVVLIVTPADAKELPAGTECQKKPHLSEGGRWKYYRDPEKAGERCWYRTQRSTAAKSSRSSRDKSKAKPKGTPAPAAPPQHFAVKPTPEKLPEPLRTDIMGSDQAEGPPAPEQTQERIALGFVAATPPVEAVASNVTVIQDCPDKLPQQFGLFAWLTHIAALTSGMLLMLILMLFLERRRMRVAVTSLNQTAIGKGRG